MARVKSEKKNKSKRSIWRILFLYIPLGFVVFTVSWVLVLKWLPVWYTPLMAVKSIENISDKTYVTYKTWKPLKKISKNMVMAVIASEDNRFDTHSGFDFVEIDRALDAHERGKKLRGASTISQQTAKNVFLFPSRSFIRKGFEAYFTLLIEIIWGKERIMEVYLNVAEMGRGVFGAEAAAKVHFKTSAYKLSPRQSALIAATLPNPIKRTASNPSNYVSRRAARIQNLMGKVAKPDWIK